MCCSLLIIQHRWGFPRYISWSASHTAKNTSHVSDHTATSTATRLGMLISLVSGWWASVGPLIGSHPGGILTKLQTTPRPGFKCHKSEVLQATVLSALVIGLQICLHSDALHRCTVFLKQSRAPYQQFEWFLKSGDHVVKSLYCWTNNRVNKIAEEVNKDGLQHISQTFWWAHNQNLGNICCCHVKNNYPIISQLYTRHNSSAVQNFDLTASRELVLKWR